MLYIKELFEWTITWPTRLKQNLEEKHKVLVLTDNTLEMSLRVYCDPESFNINEYISKRDQKRIPQILVNKPTMAIVGETMIPIKNYVVIFIEKNKTKNQKPNHCIFLSK